MGGESDHRVLELENKAANGGVRNGSRLSCEGQRKYKKKTVLELEKSRTI